MKETSCYINHPAKAKAFEYIDRPYTNHNYCRPDESTYPTSKHSDWPFSSLNKQIYLHKNSTPYTHKRFPIRNENLWFIFLPMHVFSKKLRTMSFLHIFVNSILINKFIFRKTPPNTQTYSPDMNRYYSLFISPNARIKWKECFSRYPRV